MSLMGETEVEQKMAKSVSHGIRDIPAKVQRYIIDNFFSRVSTGRALCGQGSDQNIAGNSL